MSQSHEQQAPQSTVQLEVKHQFRLGMPAPFRHDPDAHIGTGGKKGGQDPKDREQIEGMVIPHLEDNGRPQGNHSQPGHRPFLKLPLQEHRGQQAHEKGGKLGQDLCIPQGQSVETIEEKQQTGTAEQSPEME